MSLRPIVSIYSADRLAVQFNSAGKNNIELVDQPAAMMESPHVTRSAPIADDLGSNSYNFPEWSGTGIAVKADLNNDGLDDFVVGATDAGQFGSGSVIILNQDQQGSAHPWYWFGQAY